MDRWTIGTLLETAAGYLHEKGSTSPRLDAELLLAETLGLERIGLYLEFDRPLAAEEITRFRSLVARRAGHEPVAYILGRAYFRHLRVEMHPAVLIPRPETEELVGAALESLRRRPILGEPSDDRTVEARASGAPASSALVADIGTGSGVIALSLASEAGARVLAVDTSAAALEVAARNAAATGLADLVEFRRADLFSTIPDGSLHLVVSNPPYVTRSELAALAPDVRLFEPVAALDGGADGLDVIRRLLPGAARALRPGGTALLEVGHEQAKTVAALARDAGFVLVRIHKDLSQKDRIVEATLPGTTVLSPAGLCPTDLAVLAEALKAGAVIGIPTDTVYGLAARWDSPAGVRALFAAKGRAPEQSVAVVFPSTQAVKSALPDLDGTAARVLEALLPGPYTFVVATGVSRPPYVGTADSLGVRVPDHAELLALLGALDAPLAATSANISGGGDASTLTEVEPWLLAHCSAAFTTAFTGGVSASGPGRASTVVDLRPLASGEAPVILREGAVSAPEVHERIAALC